MASSEVEMSPRITVFSNIPKLAACLKNALPDLTFQEVSPGTVSLHTQFNNPAKVSENALQVLQQSEIIVGDYNILAPHLYQLPRAKWVQGTWAGADPIFRMYDPNKPPLPFVITRFSGPFFGVQMSEYVVASIVNRERCFMSFHNSQKIHKWEKDDYFPVRRSIHDLTVGILGTGQIGIHIAKVLKNFNARVWGMGRASLAPDQKLPYLDEYRSTKDLAEVLQSCDYIVNVLPETKETVGLLGGDTLMHCARKQPVFINIGRGSILTEKELVKALNEGWLSGAVLDVFPVEPLAANSSLWDMPQVTITPHVAGITRPHDVAKSFKENYERFMLKKPLINVLDLEKGY